VETFELVSADASLPRVVYIRICDNDVSIYGQGTNHASFMPTLLHPNELLDGAIVNIAWWAGNERNITYTQMNDPVVKALYARHAKELNFVGVVVGGRSGRNYADKEHRARYVVKLAGLLGAQNAVISWVKGGSSQIDLMLTCQMCERLNVKTVLLVSCYGGASGIDQAFVFTVPEATALISNGNPDETVRLPAMKRVVGGETIYETGEKAQAPLVCSTRTVLGAANRMGFNCVTTREY
jgi:sarcosine reductase